MIYFERRPASRRHPLQSSTGPRLMLGLLAAISLLLPSLAHAANNGTAPVHQNPSGIALTTGDYVSHPTGLATYYSYFVEVPPGTTNLTIELFDADTGDGPNTLDRLTGANNTSCRYSLFDPVAAPSTVLTCAPGTCVARDGVWSTFHTQANPPAGHWELRIDMSAAVTAGNDSNGFAIRAHDGDITAGGVELNVYALSYTAPTIRGGAVGTPFTTIDYPYLTSGCDCDVDEFDWDVTLPTVNGDITVTSPSTAFSQSFSGATLSGDAVWASHTFMGWTSDPVVADYGVWRGAFTLQATATNNNYSVVYFGAFNAAAPPPTAQPQANTFRIYLPNDAGVAPVKPVVSQRAFAISGPNPPVAGMLTRVAVSVQVDNPTPFPITFSAVNQVTANVPGGGVVYVGASAMASQGTVTAQPAGGGTGNVTWNPGVLAGGASAVLTYRVDVTPPGAGRLPITGTPALNGTTAVFLDETGVRLDTFGPICELAIQPGNAIPGQPIGVAKQMSATGTGPYTVTIDYEFENFGTQAISNLSAIDDLTAVFGATPANWTFTSITKLSGPASFDRNAAYTGAPANTELINPGSSLAPGEVGQIRVVISVLTPGTFVNQVQVGGRTSTGVLVGDMSTDGGDADPNGDNNPGESTPSTVTLETPVIGAAKQMSVTGTGPYTVTIDYAFENLGNVALSNLSAIDDLTAVFGATPANWTFTSITKLGGPASFDRNAAYTGSGTTQLINAGSSLAPGEVGSIRVVISVTTPGTYTNQVTVTGQSPGGANVSDDSTSGTDPDPNGDGNPGENTPSTVSFETPVIGAAKQMSVTGTGPYTVTIDYAFENLGNVALSSLSAIDDLVAVFGATPANWSFTSIAKLSGPASFDRNAAYTGAPANTELINPGSSLAPGEVGGIRVVISVTTPGTYTNQVTVTGQSPGGANVSDVSTDGTDPDPNGDGNPGENTPSTVSFETPVIGAAKQMSVTGTGPYTVTIDYAFENLGNVVLSSLSAIDDLVAVFGATPANWSFTSIAKLSGPASFDRNAAYTGAPANTELINPGSSLAPGEVGGIRVVISVTTPGTYTNQVTVTGQSPGGANVSDVSTDGTDPDPNGDGNPGENTPSTVSFETPVIGAAKQMSSTGTGPWTVTIDYAFENLGNVVLSNLSAIDDLTAVFGATPANWTFTSIAKLSGPASFDRNAGYNGSGNTQLINPGSSLAPGELGSIRVVISVTTPGTYDNQVTVTGQSPGGANVSDDSTDGTDPDPNGDGNPGEGTPSTITLTSAPTNPVIGAAKQMSATGTGPWTVTIAYAFENLGDVPLSNLSAPDDLAAVFGVPGTDWNFLSIAKTGGPASFDANVGFTGVTPTTELIAVGSSLLPGEIGQIEVMIQVITPGSFVNQVTVTAEGPGGEITTDDSDAGTNPDTNGDGIPDEGDPSMLELGGDVIVIPTLGEWGLALFAALIALAAITRVRRRI